MKKVLIILSMSLVFIIILVGAYYLDDYEAVYSNRIFDSKHQDCDVETTLNENCSFRYHDDTYIEIAIESGESFHVYECRADGQLLGVYISEEGKSYYVTHSDITIQKTDSEELKQLVKSMNDNTEKLENERAVIRVVIPGVHILLFAGVVWASWKLLRRHRVSK